MLPINVTVLILFEAPTASSCGSESTHESTPQSTAVGTRARDRTRQQSTSRGGRTRHISIHTAGRTPAVCGASVYSVRHGAPNYLKWGRRSCDLYRYIIHTTCLRLWMPLQFECTQIDRGCWPTARPSLASSFYLLLERRGSVVLGSNLRRHLRPVVQVRPVGPGLDAWQL
jgi:hypothetical protein